MGADLSISVPLLLQSHYKIDICYTVYREHTDTNAVMERVFSFFVIELGLKYGCE